MGKHSKKPLAVQNAIRHLAPSTAAARSSPLPHSGRSRSARCRRSRRVATHRTHASSGRTPPHAGLPAKVAPRVVNVRLGQRHLLVLLAVLLGHAAPSGGTLPDHFRRPQAAVRAPVVAQEVEVRVAGLFPTAARSAGLAAAGRGRAHTVGVHGWVCGTVLGGLGAGDDLR